MSKLFSLFLIVLLSVGVMAEDAFAKRFGGGKSIGKQRDSVTQRAEPRAPAQAPTAAPNSVPSRGSKWFGPLAGLAAGGLLGALLFGGAFDGIKPMDIIVILALVMAAVFIIRMLRKPQTPSQRMQYSGVNGEPVVAEHHYAGGGTAPSTRVKPNIPANFEVQPFLRNAKTSFIRLQAANDAKDLSDVRDYTTPEMYAEIAMQMQERGNVSQKTEVLALDAELLEVVTEGDLAVASVRFTGQIREHPNAASEPFDEVWHVQKALNQSNSVWLLSGIQQVGNA